MAEEGHFNYLSICTELDDLAIRILNVLQNIILERQYLDDNLKDGFINMAKSRYVMRGQKIAAVQINSANLIASKNVIANIHTVDGVEFTSFSISKRKSANVSTKIDKSESNENSDFEYLSESDINPAITENPLHWFGMLVPETLKSCQSRFEQAIETSAKIATLQNELKALCEKYRILRERKSVSLA